ncbi:MAG: hypothetical protein IPK78_04140 [Rhodospirillales bacterium]|nr:hypothetical protein [Rhodospirillales bacterium]
MRWRFFVDAGRQSIAVDLARLGQIVLGLDVPPHKSLEDQGFRTLAALGAAPTLLIYDNVQDVDTVLAWLPPAGMPCHVLVTTTLDRWHAGWEAIEVPPLSAQACIDLTTAIAGETVSDRFGAELARLAGGLPVQIVPAAATLAHEARRGRLDAAVLTLTEEAQQSFCGVFNQLEPPVQLLLRAAAQFTPQRIPRDELQFCLTTAVGWSEGEFQRRLDTCLDRHVMQDGAELWMHQLFAAFLQDEPSSEHSAASIKSVAAAQAARMVTIALEVANHPNRADLSAKLLAFGPDFAHWRSADAELSPENGEAIGRALSEIGRFADAQPWFERAVAAKEQGDVHGRVDHESLGGSLRAAAACLRQLGRETEANACENAGGVATD